jgi:hypothetical protein
LTVDVKQFWTFEFEKIVEKIRHDFEQFYGIGVREMTEYYKTKMEQIEIEVKKTLDYQQIEIVSEEQTLQIEYEQVQKSYSYEKELVVKLEATCCK